MEPFSAPTVARAGAATGRKVTRRQRFLALMERIVPWQQLAATIEPWLAPAGASAACSLQQLDRALRLYLLQQWYSLGDDDLAEALHDSGSLQQFAAAAAAPEAAAPDAASLRAFRRLLDSRGLGPIIAAQVDAQLRSHGLQIRGGAIVEPALGAAPPARAAAKANGWARRVA